MAERLPRDFGADIHRFRDEIRDGETGELQAYLHGFGHYHETYAKGDDGRWRIAKLRLERIRIDPL